MKVTKVDERDTMFARANYKEGTPAYEAYYSRNPHKKELDDTIRSKPGLCAPGSGMYDELIGPMAGAAFHFLGDIKHLSEGEVAGHKVQVQAEEITKKIKGFAKLYGAIDVGITEIKDEHLYSHRGRHTEHYGEEVKLHHTYAIVFAVPMKAEMINRGPMISEVLETSKAYVDAAVVGMVLGYYIRSLGYEARNHMDANYLLNLVAVAKDAGLGEVGRNGLLTHRTQGSMLRLGAVTTTLELVQDAPISFGLEAFCKACNQCARNCFSKSISSHEDSDTWRTNQENCYSKWCDLGTDCGMCLGSCPFSQELESLEGVENFATDYEQIKRVLEEYKEKFGNRAFIREKPEWLE